MKHMDINSLQRFFLNIWKPKEKKHIQILLLLLELNIVKNYIY